MAGELFITLPGGATVKVRVTYRTPDISVDEVFVGESAEAVVTSAQRHVGSRVNFAVRLLVNSLGPVQFAQEVVRRYNDAFKRSLPLPRSCAEFLELAAAEGLVTIIEA